MPDLRQHAGNSVANDATNNCYVTFDTPTQSGSLIVVIASAVHEPDGSWPVVGPSGYTLAAPPRVQGRLTIAVWYLAAAPATSSVGVYSSADDTLQVRALEITGAAQANPLDKVVVRSDSSTSPSTGSTGTTSQADEFILAAISNHWPSTGQSGFTGGLAKLSETVSVDRWGPGGQNHINDDRRSRLTVHIGSQATAASWSLGAKLGTTRSWVAVLLTFKGGTTGPARMTSMAQPPVVTIDGGGTLSMFGPLRSTLAPPIITSGGGGRIGPFSQQMRLGGYTGLLIGTGTPYRIEQIEGLGGWDVRVADSDLSRQDGAQRGVDLQAARLIKLVLNFDDADTTVLEGLHTALLAALVPQSTADLDLLFRLAGRPLQLVRYRPIQLDRTLDLLQLRYRQQEVMLRCADPRVYSAREKTLVVPVTPANQSAPAAVAATNEGNGRAYPVITITNRDTVPVTAIQLVNPTANVAYEVAVTIAPGSVLTGDMPQRITSGPTSPVTLDGASKYGAWAPPREPFYIAPDPIAPAGVNALYLRTTPPGALVDCTLTYRDTSSG